MERFSIELSDEVTNARDIVMNICGFFEEMDKFRFLYGDEYSDYHQALDPTISEKDDFSVRFYGLVGNDVVEIDMIDSNEPVSVSDFRAFYVLRCFQGAFYLASMKHKWEIEKFMQDELCE